MHWYEKVHWVHGSGLDLAMENHVKHVLLLSPADLADVLMEMESWMNVLGYPGRDLFAVKLALREAVSNAFRHGNRGSPGTPVQVSYLVTAGEVMVSVEDQGVGFDLKTVPDPLTEERLDHLGGRGIFLMRAYMTWVHFESPGNRVTLCLHRSPPFRLQTDDDPEA
jgi:serine/threonine-protein kinase RsbW